MNKRIYILNLTIVFLFTGCATILGGKKNKLMVEDGAPPSAEVWLDGQKLGTTPIDLKLDKHLIQDGSILEIKMDGCMKPIKILLSAKCIPGILWQIF
jgi:hypothetical protein